MDDEPLPGKRQNVFKTALHKIPARLKWVAGVWVLGLLVNQFLRWVLYLVNPGEFAEIDLSGILPVTGTALRFDLATLTLTQGLLAVAVLLPLRATHPGYYPRVWALLATLSALPMLLLNGADIAYFPFTHRRSTYELATMTREVGQLSGSFMLEYWWLTLLISGLCVAYFWLTWRLGRHTAPAADTPRALWQPIAWCLLVTGLLFLAYRGGLQQVPLRPADAFRHRHFVAGHLASNSVFTIYHSLTQPPEAGLALDNQGTLPLARYMVASTGEVFPDNAYTFWRKRTTQGPPRRLNVVVILLESFSATYVGALNHAPADKSLTPHLDALCRKGLLFTSFYANGSRSAEVFPAILNGLPDMYARPIIGSDMETHYPHGLGHILRQQGYTTAMFHGGRNGSLGLDTYARFSGITYYYGKNEYPEALRDDDDNGAWGIHDGPFLHYAASKFRQLAPPYYTVLFTLSSHHPFVYPKGVYPDIDERKDLRPFEKTVLYTDRSLGRFMQQMATLPEHDSTVYLITADHSFNQPGDPLPPFPENYRIPLLIYAPKLIPTGITEVPGTQVNIPATVLQLLNIPASYAAMGASLLDSSAFHFAINHYSNLYSFETREWAWLTNFEDYNQYMRREGTTWTSAPSMPQNLQQKMRAFLLQAYYSVRHNRIAPKP
ncbi:MAG: sulfatase-like hydrolase/transferase [Bacteroidetes bacterium]|nr:sulfatase-like hydrolase/transferase [Bacteroidota bacterium]